MFDHELPVAAIPERAVANIAHPEEEPYPVTVEAIHHSTPRPGLITWDTDQGPVTLSAALRVPVNLPTTSPRKDSTDVSSRALRHR